MSLDKIQDENVRRLAQTLRTSGMAASDSEAIRMAQEMASTSGRVQQGYNDYEKKRGIQDESAQKPSFQTFEESSQKFSANVSTDSNDDSFENRFKATEQESESINLGTKNLYEQQKDVVNSGYEEVFDEEKTLNELMAEDSEHIYALQSDSLKDESSSESEGVIESDSMESSSQADLSENSLSEPDSVSSIDLDFDSESNSASEQFKDEDFEVDETVEIENKKKSEEERKKEYQKMAESKIDLSEVFKFK